MGKIYKAEDITFDVLSKWTKKEWDQFGNSFRDPNVKMDGILFWANHTTGFWYAYITDDNFNKILQWNKHGYYWEKTYGHNKREIAYRNSDYAYYVCGNKVSKDTYENFMEQWYNGYSSYDEDNYSVAIIKGVE